MSSLSSVVPLVQTGETDANVAKFLNRYLDGGWSVSSEKRATWWGSDHNKMGLAHFFAEGLLCARHGAGHGGAAENKAGTVPVPREVQILLGEAAVKTSQEKHRNKGIVQQQGARFEAGCPGRPWEVWWWLTREPRQEADPSLNQSPSLRGLRAV